MRGDTEHLTGEETKVVIDAEMNSKQQNNRADPGHPSSSGGSDCHSGETTVEHPVSLDVSQVASHPSQDQSSLSQVGRQSLKKLRPVTDQEEDRPKCRDRGVSVSSLSSISSFSSSFMIDRIFHWRKSSGVRSPDSDTVKSFRMSEVSQPRDSVQCSDLQLEQIDQLDAESLATFITSTVGPGQKRPTQPVPENPVRFHLKQSEQLEQLEQMQVPEKPVRFHIRQLEQLLLGLLRPPAPEDPGSVRLRLDSLRVLESLDRVSLHSSSSSCHDLYDVPRCL